MTDENQTAEETIAETIAGAEEVRDPLEGLVEKTKLDPGAPFTPDVLERLVELRQNDPAAFETLRAQLKKARCRVTALDAALGGDGGGGQGPSQSEILLEIAGTIALFHSPDKIGYADLDINGHRETWAIRSRGFRQWLAHRFYAQTAGAPNSEALQSALNVIEARARFDAPERAVHVRVGGIDGKIYLDLCDETWRAVEIDADGWRVVNSPQVRFRRAAGMLPLPLPVRGGSIEELRPFLNVRSNHEFVLAVTWLLAALRDIGPYPVLALFGEQGTAKSTFAKILRMLLDPNTMPLRSPPREDRDLYIAAMNGHVLVFDNFSSLVEWISDTLCRLSTGGGFATRQLYTDQDEVLFDATRPVILNGIEDIINRPDLADRAILLTLQPIPDDKRRLETEIWDAFELVRPRILGALLDAVAMGLQRLPQVKLPSLPRMADFAIWATACETGLSWSDGTFMEAYRSAIEETVESVLNASLVGTAVRAFMENQAAWSGTATDLLELLGKVAGERAVRAKTWPADATRLGGRLRREATFLRKVGIEISIGIREGLARTRTITITSEGSEGGNSASAASVASKPNNFSDGFRPKTHPPASVASVHADSDGNGTDATDAGEGVFGRNPSEKYIGSLSAGRVCELAGDHVDAAAAQLEETGDVDRAALERRLREILAAEVAPEAVETEFARIMAATEAF